jgi:hypothetical protein
MIETAKHSRRELNIPEELERTRRNDASWETTNLAFKYQLVGKRSKGRPKKRWKDQLLEESSWMQEQQT